MKARATFLKYLGTGVDIEPQHNLRSIPGFVSLDFFVPGGHEEHEQIGNMMPNHRGFRVFHFLRHTLS